jgi:quinol monooxygenase YgiN
MNLNYGFHATMTAKAGAGDGVVKRLLSATRTGPAASEHCLVFLVGRSASNPDVVHVTEGWTSQAVHDELFDRPDAKALVASLAPLLDGETHYVDEVPVGGKMTLKSS